MYEIFSFFASFFPHYQSIHTNYFEKAVFSIQSNNKNVFIPSGLIIILSPILNIHVMEMCPTSINSSLSAGDTAEYKDSL